MATPAAARALPPREAFLFKSLVKHYEEKKHKKAIKSADQILRTKPDHGETLAMKGLTLHSWSADKKAEGLELVRLGLRKDMTSSICWHVYGMVCRAEKNIPETLSCLKRALMFDKDNLQILRELSSLQIQARDYQGFVDTRRRLLGLKGNQKMNFLMFAVGLFLLGDHDTCLMALDQAKQRHDQQMPDPKDFKKADESLDPVKYAVAMDQWKYETSELLLFRNQVMREMGDPGSLEHLESIYPHVVDGAEWREQYAGLLLRMERVEASRHEWDQLLQSNPENLAYHNGLRACVTHGVAEADKITTLHSFYQELQRRFPSSPACRRFELEFLTGALYEEALHAYVQPRLRKGIPSLFADLKPLYSDPEKAALHETVFGALLRSLESSSCLPLTPSERETPCTMMWTLFLMAQHSDQIRQLDRAMQFVERAIAHTPTVIDLYLCKGRILKHMGDVAAAAESVDEARRMDLADRYLNTKASKYLLRAGRRDDAERTIALFTREGDHLNLHDMQCVWWELETARCYWRKRQYGAALKNFMHINKHFGDIHDDQEQFHTYCFKKMTLRAYVSMLRFEDKLFSYPNWARAAFGMVECYIAIAKMQEKAHAAAKQAEVAAPSAAASTSSSKADKKKARRKAERDAKAAATAAASAPKSEPAPKSAKKAARAMPREIDTDPTGAALLEEKNPLDKAAEILKKMRTARCNVPYGLLQVEVSLRRGKPLLALQGAVQAHALAGPNDALVHLALVRCAVGGAAALNARTASSDLVRQVFEQELALLLRGTTVVALQNAFVEHSQSAGILARFVAVQCSVLLSESGASAAASPPEWPLPQPGDTLSDCLEVHQRTLDVEPPLPVEFLESFVARAHELFPRSSVFAPPPQLPPQPPPTASLLAS